MFYFKRFWNEDYEERGTSDWFFETNEKGEILKQIELYSKGMVSKYSNKYIEDNFGGLGTHPLNLIEFSEFKISKEEFYNVWNNK